MKKLTTAFLATILLFLVGCETTGNKRQNGTNTSHVNTKWKHVVIHGDVHVGGERQTSRDAEQEGLGKVKAQADAQVKDSLNGNTVDGVTP